MVQDAELKELDVAFCFISALFLLYDLGHALNFSWDKWAQC